MLPLARTALRRIGDDTDVVTYVSRYTRGRFASAFGPHAALEYLPPGVDAERFSPDPAAREEMRARYGLGDRPVIVCLSRLVPRKGQDMLIRALPAIRSRVDGAALVIVGGGPYLERCASSPTRSMSTDHVVFTGGVPAADYPHITRWPMCSRCRAGRAAPAWTSKALASSFSRHPRPACRSWRATPGVRRKPCRRANGAGRRRHASRRRSPTRSANPRRPRPRRPDGRGGRRWVSTTGGGRSSRTAGDAAWC